MPGETGGLDPGGLAFRALRSSDLDLMHRWLNAPHIRLWWYDEGNSYPEVRDKYLPRIEGREAVRPFVILHENRPIGYIQHYLISDEDGYASLVSVKNSAGVDLFIGEAEYLYGGLGPRIVRNYLSERVFSDPGVEVCVIGPEPNNVAAIRAYEKAGFRFFKKIQAPGEPEYPMKLTRDESEEAGIG